MSAVAGLPAALAFTGAHLPLYDYPTPHKGRSYRVNGRNPFFGKSRSKSIKDKHDSLDATRSSSTELLFSRGEDSGEDADCESDAATRNSGKLLDGLAELSRVNAHVHYPSQEELDRAFLRAGIESHNRPIEVSVRAAFSDTNSSCSSRFSEGSNEYDNIEDDEEVPFPWGCELVWGEAKGHAADRRRLMGGDTQTETFGGEIRAEMARIKEAKRKVRAEKMARLRRTFRSLSDAFAKPPPAEEMASSSERESLDRSQTWPVARVQRKKSVLARAWDS